MDPTIRARTQPDPTPTPRRRAAGASAPSPAMAGDALTLSVPRKLVEGNKDALGHAGRILWGLVSRPGEVFPAMGRALWEMVRRPDLTVARVAERFRADPIEGVLQGVIAASALTGLVTVAALPLAFLAAPFTGGASLALLPLIGQVGSVAGTIAVGATAASIVKNEVDMARADDAADLEAESRQLGDDLANMGVTIGGYGLGRGLGATLKNRAVPPMPDGIDGSMAGTIYPGDPTD